MAKNKIINAPVRLKPRSKIWLDKNGQYAFGGGIAAILAAIRQTGSIKKAALVLNESYRYVWGRIQKAEKILGLKLIETTVGGQDKQRAQLTRFALRILDPYLKFESAIHKQINQAFNQMMKIINKERKRKQ